MASIGRPEQTKSSNWAPLFDKCGTKDIRLFLKALKHHDIRSLTHRLNSEKPILPFTIAMKVVFLRFQKPEKRDIRRLHDWTPDSNYVSVMDSTPSIQIQATREYSAGLIYSGTSEYNKFVGYLLETNLVEIVQTALDTEQLKSVFQNEFSSNTFSILMPSSRTGTQHPTILQYRCSEPILNIIIDALYTAYRSNPRNHSTLNLVLQHLVSEDGPTQKIVLDRFLKKMHDENILNAFLRQKESSSYSYGYLAYGSRNSTQMDAINIIPLEKFPSYHADYLTWLFKKQDLDGIARLLIISPILEGSPLFKIAQKRIKKDKTLAATVSRYFETALPHPRSLHTDQVEHLALFKFMVKLGTSGLDSFMILPQLNWLARGTSNPGWSKLPQDLVTLYLKQPSPEVTTWIAALGTLSPTAFTEIMSLLHGTPPVSKLNIETLGFLLAHEKDELSTKIPKISTKQVLFGISVVELMQNQMKYLDVKDVSTLCRTHLDFFKRNADTCLSDYVAQLLPRVPTMSASNDLKTFFKTLQTLSSENLALVGVIAQGLFFKEISDASVSMSSLNKKIESMGFDFQNSAPTPLNTVAWHGHKVNLPQKVAAQLERDRVLFENWLPVLLRDATEPTLARLHHTVNELHFFHKNNALILDIKERLKISGSWHGNIILASGLSADAQHQSMLEQFEQIVANGTRQSCSEHNAILTTFRDSLSAITDHQKQCRDFDMAREGFCAHYIRRQQSGSLLPEPSENLIAWSQLFEDCKSRSLDYFKSRAIITSTDLVRHTNEIRMHLTHIQTIHQNYLSFNEIREAFVAHNIERQKSGSLATETAGDLIAWNKLFEDCQAGNEVYFQHRGVVTSDDLARHRNELASYLATSKATHQWHIEFNTAREAFVAEYIAQQKTGLFSTYTTEELKPWNKLFEDCTSGNEGYFKSRNVATPAELVTHRNALTQNATALKERHEIYQNKIKQDKLIKVKQDKEAFIAEYSNPYYRRLDSHLESHFELIFMLCHSFYKVPHELRNRIETTDFAAELAKLRLAHQKYLDLEAEIGSCTNAILKAYPYNNGSSTNTHYRMYRFLHHSRTSASDLEEGKSILEQIKSDLARQKEEIEEREEAERARRSPEHFPSHESDH